MMGATGLDLRMSVDKTGQRRSNYCPPSLAHGVDTTSTAVWIPPAFSNDTWTSQKYQTSATDR